MPIRIGKGMDPGFRRDDEDGNANPLGTGAAGIHIPDGSAISMTFRQGCRRP
jgi:hypothetical protein